MVSTHLFYRPIFWIIFSMTSVSAAIFGVFYFPKAIPLLELTITINRQQALDKAKEVAKKYDLGPEDYQQAVYFTSNSTLQNYIELEAGGKLAWQKILEDRTPMPYNWCIRHFQEGNTNETLIKLTPEGNLYGFDEQLSEDEPGAQLTSEQAQEEAERFLTQDWKVNLGDFQLIESSQEIQPSARIDHSFVYEHKTVRYGEAHYRLLIIISGNKITKVNFFMNVPEAFIRRYEAMRSTNDTIANLSWIAIAILYLFFGCLVALFILFKEHLVLIGAAFKWGLLIAAVQAATSLNSLPQIWCSYNPDESAAGYLLQHLLSSGGSFISLVVLYTLTFAAAESLGRKAFGNHLQFWKLWQLPLASSYQVLGRTVSGYLIALFHLSYLVLIYIIGNYFFHWWYPSSVLSDPNILGSYLPWFTPLAQSLSAGFWEECLFRAIPLAGAALIGQRFGKRTPALIIALIVQALIFSAGHANYPAQPAYVRVVELMIPAITWGVCYLFFGLLPSIIAHFTYDAVLMSLPLLISQAPGSSINRFFVITGMLVPLIVIFAKRFKAGAWLQAPQELYNQAWRPSLPTGTEEEDQCPAISIAISNKKVVLLVGVALLGLTAWLITAHFKPDVPSLEIPQQRAIELAEQALEKQGVVLDSNWKILTNFSNPGSMATPVERYIWQTEGAEKYKKMQELGYLPLPQWIIRFAKFDTTKSESAEEYRVSINYNGNSAHIVHKLPESSPGERLTKEQAREIAHAFLKDYYHLDPDNLVETSASSTKRPERLDWFFTFEQPGLVSNPKIQTTIEIRIAGNQIAFYDKWLHLPEAVLRKNRQTEQTASNIAIIQSLLTFFFIILGLISSARLVRIRSLAYSKGLIFGGLFGIISLVAIINDLPTTLFSFTTSKPLSSQLLINGVHTIFGLGLNVTWLFFIISLIYSYRRYAGVCSSSKKIIIGVSLGVIYFALAHLLFFVMQPHVPLWPYMLGINSYIPWLNMIILYLKAYIKATVLLLLLVSLTQAQFATRSIIAIAALSVILTPYVGGISLISWASQCLVIAFLLLIYFKSSLSQDTSLIPLITAVPALITISTQLSLAAYPGSLIGVVLTIILLALMAFLWSKSLEASPNS